MRRHPYAMKRRRVLRNDIGRMKHGLLLSPGLDMLSPDGVIHGRLIAGCRRCSVAVSYLLLGNYAATRLKRNDLCELMASLLA